jgi:transcriptional regulator with XRE-family HTH domain
LAGKDWISSTLRELRVQAGLSGVRAASLAGISQSRISRIESGVFVPTEDEIRGLCRLYKAPAQARRQLLRAAGDIRAETRPSRVVLQRGTAHKLQQRIARIEADSAEIGVFQPALVPGLLQTRDYARAVFSDGGDIKGEDLEKSVEARMARAAVLDSDRQFTLIMAEGALRWQAVSPQVMAAQLNHLADLAGRVRIGVIPWTHSARVFTTHGFSIYDRRSVILGTRTRTAFITDPQDVTDYVKLFDSLTELATFGAAAQALMTALADDYREL